MKKGLLIAVLGVLAVIALSGCSQDPTVQVQVYVHDDSWNAVPNAYVSAYSNYNLGSGAGSRWTGLNGSLDASAQTDQYGQATMQVLPGNYAFSASANDGSYGGAEKLVIAQYGNYVDITVSKPRPAYGYVILDVLDEAGNPFDVKTYATTVTATVCPFSQNTCESFESPLYDSHIEGSAVPGSYTYAFSAEGFSRAELVFNVYENETTQLKVVMKAYQT